MRSSVLTPKLSLDSTTSSFLLVVLASLAIGLSGLLSIPLPFTPVPLAVRPHMILFLAVLLGTRRSSFAVFGFLLQAAAGLPILAGGALSLLGSTGGYCLGYLFAAITVGTLVERQKEQTPLSLFTALCFGNGVIYLFGAAHLAFFVGWEKSFLLGVVPFLLGDLLKNVWLVQILRWMKRV